jgi:hypothetical protein
VSEGKRTARTVWRQLDAARKRCRDLEQAIRTSFPETIDDRCAHVLTYSGSPKFTQCRICGMYVSPETGEVGSSEEVMAWFD